MTPDPALRAAVACEGLADNPAPTDAYRAGVAFALVTIPLLHPLRWHEVNGRMVDSVLDMADDVSRGRATPEALRAFAGLLRDSKNGVDV